MCCYSTEMPLTREDIERIASLGYSPDYFVEHVDGVPRLRNVEGHCVFLDPSTNKCKIYPHRPMGCRLYPLVYVPGEGVDVDPECPKAYTIDRKSVRELAPLVLRLVEMIYGSEKL
ncbi:YkgJ family cysteine cluster protein [Pyrodictium abyssi]